MFTKVLYINLDRRTDRNQHMLNQFKKLNWIDNNKLIERISAVDGKNLKIDTLNNLITTKASREANDLSQRTFIPGSIMTKGAVGCALSHRDAYLNILNGTHQYVLILEDDVYIDENFNKKLNTYLNKISDYDILYLGYHHIINFVNINDIICKPTNIVYGLFGYIVNKRIAQILLDMFPINNQIDSEIIKIYPNIKVYCLTNNNKIIFSEHSHNNNLGTDIQYIEKFDTLKNKKNKCNYIIILILAINILFLIYLLRLISVSRSSQ